MSRVADRGSSTALARPTPVGGYRKRAIDIVLAAIGIMILLPLFIFCGLSLVLTSKGPVILRYRRIGFGGRPFGLLKFRTISAGSHEHLVEDPSAIAQAVCAANGGQSHELRTTSFGATLRETGVDELPQLFNVLKGDMSLIGPRPITNSEINKCGGCVSAYLARKPGITGQWRISQRATGSHPR